jgi:hypothetical protein
MSTVFQDTFAHYGNSNVAEKYNSVTGTVAVTTGGYQSRNYLSITTGEILKTLDAFYGTIYGGFRIRSPLLDSANNALVEIDDGGVEQITLYQLDDGTYQWKRGGSILGTSTFAVSANNWDFLEFKAVIASGTGGSVEVRVNEAVILSVTGIDTELTGNNRMNGVRIMANAARHIMDFYLDNVGYHGDQAGFAMLPTGDGAYEEWAQSTGTTNWELLDENPPSMSDYIESSTAGQQASVTMPGPSGAPANYNVGSVQVGFLAVKTDAGFRQIRAGIRIGGTIYYHTKIYNLDTSNKYYLWVWDENPATSSAWTQAELVAGLEPVVEMYA